MSKACSPLDIPLEAGDRVVYTKGYLIARYAIGRSGSGGDFVAGGAYATDRGEITVIGAPLHFLATVRWDSDREEIINIRNLVAAHLIQSDLARYDRESRRGLLEHIGADR